jgi:hypothetical protein
MSETFEFEVKKTDGAAFWLPCSKCNRNTNHITMAKVSSRYVYNKQAEILEDYEIVQCKGCLTISFLHREDGSMCPESTVNVYPKRTAGRQTLPFSIFYLPERVLDIYEETISALDNNLLVLGSIGIRSTIEAICKDKLASKLNLAESIDEFAKRGFITNEGANILHGLRFMGNDSAHEVKSHTIEELLIAFDVIEHVLMGVYILPAKTHTFSKKEK